MLLGSSVGIAIKEAEEECDPTRARTKGLSLTVFNVESYLQTPGHSHRLTFIQQQKAISKVESKWCHD